MKFRKIRLVAALSLWGMGCASANKATTGSPVTLWRDQRVQLADEQSLRAASGKISSNGIVHWGHPPYDDASEDTEHSQNEIESNSSSIDLVSATQDGIATPAESTPAPTSVADHQANTDGQKSEEDDVSIGLATATFPVDITTVIRMVDENSPLIEIAEARVREAHAKVEHADLYWLPNLTLGTSYNRFDGQTQNQRGEIFSVSRSNLFPSTGLALNLDTSDAIYKPLMEQRQLAIELRKVKVATAVSELDAIGVYLDLLFLHGLLAVNSETLQKAESLLKAAQNAQAAKLERSPGDIQRVQTEVYLRRQERVELTGRASASSARLGRLILIDPTTRLVPLTREIVPVNLVDLNTPLAEMLATARQNRQDLAVTHDQVALARDRVRKAQCGPLLPKLQVADQFGSFGGGTNSDVGQFSERNAISATIYWEMKNLGFGQMSEVAEREAGVDHAYYQMVETHSRVAAEVAEAAETAVAKLQGMTIAEKAVKEAEELYRINQEGTFHVVDAKNLFDALRPLQALQVLNQTRQNYVSTIVEYSRAQFRLYTMLGRPPRAAYSTGE